MQHHSLITSPLLPKLLQIFLTVLTPILVSTTAAAGGEEKNCQKKWRRKRKTLQDPTRQASILSEMKPNLSTWLCWWQLLIPQIRLEYNTLQNSTLQSCLSPRPAGLSFFSLEVGCLRWHNFVEMTLIYLKQNECFSIKSLYKQIVYFDVLVWDFDFGFTFWPYDNPHASSTQHGQHVDQVHAALWYIMYTYMYTYIYIYVHICIFINVWICIHIRIDVYIHIYIHIYIYEYIYVYIYILRWVHISDHYTCPPSY